MGEETKSVSASEALAEMTNPEILEIISDIAPGEEFSAEDLDMIRVYAATQLASDASLVPKDLLSYAAKARVEAHHFQASYVTVDGGDLVVGAGADKYDSVHQAHENTGI